MKIRNVAVIGAGVMGLGIAQVVANSAFKVNLWSRRGNACLDRLHEGVQKAIYQGVLNEEQAMLLYSRISCTPSLSEAVKEADLVIETVIEDVTIKRVIFREVDALCMQHTILVSNTSSLSVSSLAEATKRQDKVCGMHFFNPAPVMKLIEVAQTPLTSAITIDSIVTFSRQLGKFPIIVKDSPGFVVNKILMPAINAAAFVLFNKVATAQDIDAAMKLGANHPLGPLALADLIGIDLCLKIMTELHDKFECSKYEVCPLLEKMVAEGHLGRKTGKGFFTYETH
jgi:3-hydroxybutyryl-CoA dehydrogenase